MNKQRSSGEQIFQFLLLSFGAMLLFQYFFKRPDPSVSVPPRPALTIAQAFQGIDPNQGAILTETAALQEEKKLKAQIAKNEQDPLASWSKLRIALLHQYVFKDLESKTRKSGFMGIGPMVKYFPAYDEIMTRAAGDPIEAQAIYQSGDLLWRQSTKNGALPSQEAANTFETVVQKGRTNSKFLDNKILVPSEVDPAKVPLDAIPPGGFKSVSLRELRGTAENPNPQGIADRVNIYYSTKPLFRLFDSVVKIFGSQPTYSYGLAILFFAVLTRIAIQPITKRQYDSMKGMAVIAPEMKKIQEKYKGKTEGDAQVRMMKEIRALQQRHGVNPMLGCGLAALQMPIFFFFVYPLIQNYESKMELVGASFLWINSLARPDIPLLILYGISMFFSFRLSSTPPTDDMQRQQQAIMSFIFPVLFPFFILTYPSAFTMYWMTYNAVSTVFQWRMMKAADPKKNIIKTLMGADLVVINPDADAVPERPKGEKKALEAGDSGLNGAHLNGNSSNGAAKNGSSPNSNGKAPKSAENGTVLTPLSNNGTGEKKKKKR
jgi:YidC/Oxa1 family membrane protein insertase